MGKRIALLVLLLVFAGGGYYVYRYGWKLPTSLGALFSTSDDAVTTGKVKAALGLSKRVSAFDIGVDTRDGVVTLTGQVASEDIKSLAGEIARDTEGVKEVNNQIAVNPGAQPSPESVRVEDLEIRAAILAAFQRSPELSGKNIDVKVENRLVTLSGSVETPAQRNGAEQAARAISGVAGVTNELAVTNPQAQTEPPAATAPPVDLNAELAKKVQFELFLTEAFNVSTMTIRAEDGTIILSGSVRSRAEQLLAERVAQGTPGVKKVVNELRVAAAPAARK
ncbi:MAG TPA: BON domain-containing protein [Blastocatellia bacterium]|nr:BON domain-containing protein [Blastocatellia bacterium]